MATLYTQHDANIRKTWLLMTMFLGLVIVVGWLFSYAYNTVEILYFAVALSVIMNLVAYWKSDKIALAISRARAIERAGHEYLYRIVENLSITAGLPLPRLYLIDSPQINAFATGRDPKHAAIAVTTGAIEKLKNEELEGVLAHELSHIGNNDILISSIAVVLAGLISILADWFIRMSIFGHGNSNRSDREGGNALVLAVAVVAAILAPLAATLIRLAISRKREFLADASGALLTRYPDGLANALEKISADSVPMKSASNSMAHLFISNPFKGKQEASWFTRLFMTHPPLTERIRILRGMRPSNQDSV